MRATDDRYRAEQNRFELAMRMISHEARTGTIRYWTGLSDDRIRKIYTSYFKYANRAVRRRRGKSPTQVTPLVHTPERTLESGVMANLLQANGLYSHEAPPGPVLRHNVALGHRFCECYETYQSLVDKTSLSFEWSWNLLVSMRRGEELGIARCAECSLCFVYDLLSVPRADCPICSLFPAREAALPC